MYLLYSTEEDGAENLAGIVKELSENIASKEHQLAELRELNEEIYKLIPKEDIYTHSLYDVSYLFLCLLYYFLLIHT